MEPGLFDVWTNIVKATPNATLWLLKFPKEAVKRLEVSVLRGFRASCQQLMASSHTLATEPGAGGGAGAAQGADGVELAPAH